MWRYVVYMICVLHPEGPNLYRMGDYGWMHMEDKYREVQWYLQYLEDHGRRPLTIETVGICLRHMIDILEAGGRPTKMKQIKLEDVRWLANQLGVKESTQAEYIRAFSRMSIQLGCQDWGKRLDILYNRPEPDRVWIDVDQFVTLYNAAQPWDRMMLVLGAFMGLRRMEISNLRDEDIDLKARKMTVHGKGHGPKGLVVTMDIPIDVVKEIEEFRAYKDAHYNPAQGDDVGRFIQVPRWGRWTSIEPVTISQHIKNLGDAHGIRVTTHALRRLYATTLVNVVEADLDTVRRLMRHSDISTTVRCYVAADPTKQLDAQRELMSVYARALGKT